VRPGDNRAHLRNTALASKRVQLMHGGFLVAPEKIVSKSEGRYVALSDVIPSKRARQLTAEDLFR
jgi:coenzyme F420-0:L-glutamate ligase/coenzyme F420-1:gamma-L-glutamate ligase